VSTCLPVTRRWLEQATLGLTMIAHASMRGVVEFMHDVLGVSISLGSVNNINQRAAQRAVVINDSVDLSAIRVGREGVDAAGVCHAFYIWTIS
jgi:hypothetical protein